MKLEIWPQIDNMVFQIVVITLEIVVCKVCQAPEKSPVRSCINAVNKPKINCVAACSIPPIAVNTTEITVQRDWKAVTKPLMRLMNKKPRTWFATCPNICKIGIIGWSVCSIDALN
ncbi:hypothetical protein Phi456_00073 [Staphylococcus phage 456]|nr:hypothetical protein Phi456_00073 [Staphylococcus phage 456]